MFPVEIQHLHITLYCKIRYHSMFIIEMEEEKKNGYCSRLFGMNLLHGMHHPIFHHIMTNDFTCINMHKPIWTCRVTHREIVTHLSKNIIELLFRIWWIPVRIAFLISARKKVWYKSFECDIKRYLNMTVSCLMMCFSSAEVIILFSLQQTFYRVMIVSAPRHVIIEFCV